MIHSGNVTRQRKEERLLRERLQDMEAKLDRALAMEKKEVAAKPPSPSQDPRITALARAMGDKDYHLPSGSIANLTFDDNGEVIATGLTIEGRFWSIEDIIRFGLINERGAWLWSKYSAIAAALQPVTNDYLRPHWRATVAGRTYERGADLG